MFARLNKQWRLREAVLLTFCDPPPPECSLLGGLSRREWRRLLTWLDTSGLALYFLDRLRELGQEHIVPPVVLSRLQKNLADNIERTLDMIAESNAIHAEFQRAGLSYATLKGSSLWPWSMPRLELRSQLDLDFLIAEESVHVGRRILEERGYRLNAISGRSWEFKTEHMPTGSLKDLYKPSPLRSAELHVETRSSGRPSLLARAEMRALNGIIMPVLAPADLFLGQALHLYRHVCHDFARTSHLLEFRRHVVARRKDEAFWVSVEQAAEENPMAWFGLGLVTLLSTHVMGEFAPEKLTCWTVDRLPGFARLWVEMYGRNAVFDGFPGNKLNLLLSHELSRSGVTAKRSLRQALLPTRLPPPVMHTSVGESREMRARRYHLQSRVIALRLRFHTVEGCRFLLESLRWQRQMRRMGRSVRSVVQAQGREVQQRNDKSLILP